MFQHIKYLTISNDYGMITSFGADL